MNRLQDVLEFSVKYLQKRGIEKARVEAEKLISHILHTERILLYADFEKVLEEEEKKEIRDALKVMATEKLTFDSYIEKIKKQDSTEYSQNRKELEKENKELLAKSIKYMEGHEIENAKLETELIFEDILGVRRMMLSLNMAREISEEMKEKIRKMLRERAIDKRPIQYVIGHEGFYGRNFSVDEAVLIPRPETEELVEECLKLIKEKNYKTVLDIGTGSGAIGITIAKEAEEVKVLACDISEKALEKAKENAEKLEAKNIKFVKSNVFESIKFKDFDMIVSNPPYIPQHEYDELQEEVKKFEPKSALVAEREGYYFYNLISYLAPAYLKKGGTLAFEVGYNQGYKVKEFMEKNAFINIRILKDYQGIERMVIGEKE